MPRVRLLGAVLVVCGLAIVDAQAAGENPPAFPRSYHGSISGTLEAHDTSDAMTTTKGSWTITGVSFRRLKPLKSDVAWQVSYSATGGKLTYHEAETGSCSYTIDLVLPLRSALDKFNGPLALTQYFNVHKTTASGEMTAAHTVNVRETCGQPGSDVPPQTSERTIALATLFDPGERRVKLGGPLAGRFSTRDDSQVGSRTTKWTWALRPGR